MDLCNLFDNDSPDRRPPHAAPHAAAASDDPATSPHDATSQRDPDPLVLDTARGPVTLECEPGDEAAVLERLASLTRDPDASVEAFSAARLADQIGRRLRDRVAEIGRRCA